MSITPVPFVSNSILALLSVELILLPLIVKLPVLYDPASTGPYLKLEWAVLIAPVGSKSYSFTNF